jgi:hypothetical protein
MPIVNWKYTPAYNIAKFITKTIKETDLLYTYTMNNSVKLINNISINENARIYLFDIRDMYTNIPQQDVTHNP